MTSLTHLDAAGAAHMVDVSAKDVTRREATASATLTTTPAVMRLLVAGELPKGEAFAVARVAGILAAKRTSDLVPLCHPLPIAKVSVDFAPGPAEVVVTATVVTTSRTGVEMEALTAVSVAALTLYDMVKGVDRAAVITDVRAAVITDVRVLAKSGGRSGDWTREESDADADADGSADAGGGSGGHADPGAESSPSTLSNGSGR
jgi:cyclic pyranopterin monophosphate synthase